MSDYKNLIEKIAKQNTTDETEFWNDRLKPTLKRSLAEIGATAAGVGGTALLTKNPMAASIGGGLAGLGTGAYLNDKALRKKSKQLLGRDATTNERLYSTVGKPLAGLAISPPTAGVGTIASIFTTPESQVKRRLRAKKDGVNDEGLYFWNDKHRRDKQSKSASQVHYELEIEKKAEIYFEDAQDRHRLLYDADYEDIEGLDEESINEMNEKANDYINNHPKKDKAFEDMNYNSSKIHAKHKHSGKVRKAGVALGTVAPTVIGAGLGAIAGGINPKSFTQKSQGNFVYPTLTKGQAARKGARLFAQESFGTGNMNLPLAPQLLGATIGGSIGNKIADKMDVKAKKKMGPNRYENIDIIESDLNSYLKDYKNLKINK